jgi:hypothetical protein
MVRVEVVYSLQCTVLRYSVHPSTHRLRALKIQDTYVVRAPWKATVRSFIRDFKMCVVRSTHSSPQVRIQVPRTKEKYWYSTHLTYSSITLLRGLEEASLPTTRSFIKSESVESSPRRLILKIDWLMNNARRSQKNQRHKPSVGQVLRNTKQSR